MNATTTKQAQAALTKLVEDGCILWHKPSGTLHHVGYAELLPNVVKWATAFAEDQHHTHRTPYRTALAGVGLALYGSTGLVCHFYPLDGQDAEGLLGPALADYVATHRRWQRELADPAALARWEQFWAHTLG